MTAETSFPCAEWFQTLCERLMSDTELRKKLGFAEFRLLVEIGGEEEVRRFGIVLDGYDVLSTGETADPATFGPDAILAGSLAVWREMVANIEEHGQADRSHTLNALSIADTPLRLSGDDPLGRDKFFRYAATLQALFDTAGTTTATAA